MTNQMLREIRKAMHTACLNGKMSTRVSVETTFELETMLEEGTQVDDWRLEDGCVVITSNGYTFTL